MCLPATWEGISLVRLASTTSPLQQSHRPTHCVLRNNKSNCFGFSSASRWLKQGFFANQISPCLVGSGKPKWSLNLEETTYYLFFECPFSTRCRKFVGISWDHVISFLDTIQKAKVQCQHQFFMDAFIIAAWEIWKQINAQIFSGTQPSFQSWKICFVHTVMLHLHRLSPLLVLASASPLD